MNAYYNSPFDVLMLIYLFIFPYFFFASHPLAYAFLFTKFCYSLAVCQAAAHATDV